MTPGQASGGSAGAGPEESGTDAFLGQAYRAWMLDEAGRQFSHGPTSDEVREAMHAAGPPPFVLAEGVRFPLGVASAGLVILSYLPDEEVDAYLARARLTERWGPEHADDPLPPYNTLTEDE